jgi:hypothetical protein
MRQGFDQFSGLFVLIGLPCHAHDNDEEKADNHGSNHILDTKFVAGR